MQPSDFLMLLGGLALFLYGMQMMSGGLEAAAGNRMKGILEKLTASRVKGVLVGAGITAVIQSSSATTVMVVGFVSAGLMSLSQAVGVIMGANIGTTVTGQLIALDISAAAPLIAFVGVVLTVFVKRERLRHIGAIIAGLGVLFIGMDMMSGAMEPLQDSEVFTRAVTNFDNPVIGILVGAGFTALIQSSSASVGILQALAVGGLIGLPQAVYVLFGQNIGTCITAVLAAIGTKTEAKRTTLIHLMFNIFGTMMFTLICMATPFVAFMEGLTPGNGAAQIANVHTVFNVVTTLILLPFGGQMAKIAVRILPEGEEEAIQSHRLLYLEPVDSRKNHQMGQLSISIGQLNSEVQRMLQMTVENIKDAFDDVLSGTADHFDVISGREAYLDYLDQEISKYIAKVIPLEMSADDSRRISGYFRIVENLERIGDHGMNIADHAYTVSKESVRLTGAAMKEIRTMKYLALEALQLLQEGAGAPEAGMLVSVAKKEQQMDDMSRSFRDAQIRRMKEDQCSAEAGIIFSEMITDFERIGDHALNIAQEYVRM